MRTNKSIIHSVFKSMILECLLTELLPKINSSVIQLFISLFIRINIIPITIMPVNLVYCLPRYHNFRIINALFLATKRRIINNRSNIGYS